jgi:predicted alpha/beta superfamily hydrolase
MLLREGYRRKWMRTDNVTFLIEDRQSVLETILNDRVKRVTIATNKDPNNGSQYIINFVFDGKKVILAPKIKTEYIGNDERDPNEGWVPRKEYSLAYKRACAIIYGYLRRGN